MKYVAVIGCAVSIPFDAIDDDHARHVASEFVKKDSLKKIRITNMETGSVFGVC